MNVSLSEWSKREEKEVMKDHPFCDDHHDGTLAYSIDESVRKDAVEVKRDTYTVYPHSTLKTGRDYTHEGEERQ